MTQIYPYCSVIVPTYSRPKQLAACLNALSQLEYQKDQFEVIVVDDGSEISPAEIVADFEARMNIRMISQPNSGPATARNKGALHARGQLLAFTDDDCLPEPFWLDSLVARFVRNPDHAIGGRTVNSLTDNSYSAASQMLIDYLYGYYNGDSDNARFVASNNLAFPTEMFRQIGGFDNQFMLVAAEDRELCDRWLYYGHRIIYAPEAVVRHAHELNFSSFCRQHFNYGRGAFDFHRARAARNQSRVKVEPFSFYSDLLSYPFSKLSTKMALEVSALLGISQAANAMGFFWTMINQIRVLT
jgi:glycosyltransferase involved in cell wall biosynthesis